MDIEESFDFNYIEELLFLLIFIDMEIVLIKVGDLEEYIFCII